MDRREGGSGQDQVRANGARLISGSLSVGAGARRPGLARQRPSAGAGPGAAQRRRLIL